MPVIKVRDLAYGRLRAPDLDAMEEFLTHFGMIRAARIYDGPDEVHRMVVARRILRAYR